MSSDAGLTVICTAHHACRLVLVVTYLPGNLITKHKTDCNPNGALKFYLCSEISTRNHVCWHHVFKCVLIVWVEALISGFAMSASTPGWKAWVRPLSQDTMSTRRPVLARRRSSLLSTCQKASFRRKWRKAFASSCANFSLCCNPVIAYSYDGLKSWIPGEHLNAE